MLNLVYGWLALLTVAVVVVMSAAMGCLLGRKMVLTSLTIFGWLGFTASLAYSGFLSVWDAKPPHFPLVPLVALAAVVLLQRGAVIGRLLADTPRHWPVAMQTFRIGVELAFWGLFVGGGAPSQVTFEGRNVDVLVGLSAPLVAWAIARMNLAPRLVIGWNVLGLAILSNTIFTTLTSLPGPAHLAWQGAPFTAFGDWPFVWIPAFLAPLAIFLHIFSIRQNLAALRRPAG
ncbi:hypothetical protein [Duganella aceris]|uniref:Uncharacterized protein n=1 Tax=Duganella aceris TaxID=2703883 RepID=A0ABX0FGT5_9BURK|nr:hypothetical protein [Duganella aceris]NGZ83719.1 hypothetical protein [Duganella aceris]